MQITDLQDMPEFNERASNGRNSVQLARVFIYKNKERETICCHIHGAINCVTDWNEKGGRIWRCLNCNEGAYEIKELEEKK